jgi:hypothetical protein
MPEQSFDETGEHCKSNASRRAHDRRALTGEAGNASRRKVIVEATARSLEWASAWRTQDESGPTFSRVIRTNFGDRMAKIFRENSDSLAVSLEKLVSFGCNKNLIPNEIASAIKNLFNKTTFKLIPQTSRVTTVALEELSSEQIEILSSCQKAKIKKLEESFKGEINASTLKELVTFGLEQHLISAETASSILYPKVTSIALANLSDAEIAALRKCQKAKIKALEENLKREITASTLEELVSFGLAQRLIPNETANSLKKLHDKTILKAVPETTRVATVAFKFLSSKAIEILISCQEVPVSRYSHEKFWPSCLQN